MLLCCSEEHKSSLESFFSAPLTFSLCCFSSVLETSCWIFSLGSYRDFLRKKEHAFMPCSLPCIFRISTPKLSHFCLLLVQPGNF